MRQQPGNSSNGQIGPSGGGVGSEEDLHHLANSLNVYNSSAAKPSDESDEGQALLKEVESDAKNKSNRVKEEFKKLVDNYFAGNDTGNQNPYDEVKRICDGGAFSVAQVIDIFSTALKRYECADEKWAEALNTFATVYPRIDAERRLKSAAANSLKNFIDTALRSTPKTTQAARTYYLLTHSEKLFNTIADLSTGKYTIHDQIYRLFDYYKHAVCELICKIPDPTHKADVVEKALSKNTPLGRLFWHQQGPYPTSLLTSGSTLNKLRAAYKVRYSTRHEQPGTYKENLLQSASTADIRTLQDELEEVTKSQAICDALFVAIKNPNQNEESAETLRLLLEKLDSSNAYENSVNGPIDENGNTLLMQAILFQNQHAINSLLSKWVLDFDYTNKDGHTIHDVVDIASSGQQLKYLKEQLAQVQGIRSNSRGAGAAEVEQPVVCTGFSISALLPSFFCPAAAEAPASEEAPVDDDFGNRVGNESIHEAGL